MNSRKHEHGETFPDAPKYVVLHHPSRDCPCQLCYLEKRYFRKGNQFQTENRNRKVLFHLSNQVECPAKIFSFPEMSSSSAVSILMLFKNKTITRLNINTQLEQKFSLHYDLNIQHYSTLRVRLHL